MSNRRNKNSNCSTREKGQRYNRSRSNGKARKDENCPDEQKAGGVPVRTSNNPAWYTRFPQLTRDAASLWFSNPLGARVQRVSAAGVLSGYKAEGLWGSIPGIMVLRTILGPGTSADANSPLNATSRDIYSFIRHANSGHANYNAPDLTMYLLCLDAYYTVWAKMVRAYGVATLVTKTSRYTAVRLLEALGFDPNNILANLANFRYSINNFAVKLGSYATPGSMEIYKRHTEIYTNLYQDSTSTKAQTYILDPAGYYVYGEESAQGGKLTYTDYPNHLMTVDDVNSIFSTFNSVIGSEDMNIISGDILKAYGREAIFNVPSITEEYTTPVILDPLMLSQIENATVLGVMEVDSLNISQNPQTNQVIYLPSIVGRAGRYPALTLNLHDSPDIDKIMEATRFMVTFGDYDEVGNRTPVLACGSDIVISQNVYTYGADGTFMNIQVPVNPDINVEPNKVADIMGKVTVTRAFAFAPRNLVWWGDYLVADNLDYDEYTTISPEMLWNIHNAALLSLFDVPRIAMPRQQ